MGVLGITGLALVAVATIVPAEAQRIESAGQPQMTQQQMPPPMRPQMHPGMQPQIHPVRGGQMPPPRQHRWGGSAGGHWSGGVNAPGGWHAYRRPTRGWTLPRYWIAPTFYISDYAGYGLSQPPYGYNWTRYYDDAVLMDQRGQVWDSVSGVDWDGYDGGDAYSDGSEGGYGGDHGASYPAPGPGNGAPNVVYAQPSEVVQGGYSTSYSTGYAQGGFVKAGYWYPPAIITTVTVQSAPVISTTTTEYVDTVATYTPARRVYHAPKRKWRPPVRRHCSCSCCR